MRPRPLLVLLLLLLPLVALAAPAHAEPTCERQAAVIPRPFYFHVLVECENDGETLLLVEDWRIRECTVQVLSARAECPDLLS